MNSQGAQVTHLAGNDLSADNAARVDAVVRYTSIIESPLDWDFRLGKKDATNKLTLWPRLRWI